ncbi:hypothetical protein GTW25_18675 [Aliihoeflea aestuarii]|jgi:hypothetical protein|uniref:hypothetical protein n=1 Tax=Aliihoeflea aestuarii TaxID=453840 RepID=UPI0020942C95|nr:hypothetical protein [Aliihoeflea aestuarii]MCO6393049.1 hypothetical protein [Aliihoeflea aestuarii]
MRGGMSTKREAAMTITSTSSLELRKFSDDDCLRLRDAIDAVCEELGLDRDAAPRRAVVEARMRDAFKHGPRHNLNLVDAGLRAV